MCIRDRNIYGVTQESLRAQIGVVTQDTSLLHRSIRDNIAYTFPEISDENLDMALSMTQKMLQPQWMITLSVLGGTFMGFFYSLIISFFVKKEDSNFTI